LSFINRSSKLKGERSKHLSLKLKGQKDYALYKELIRPFIIDAISIPSGFNKENYSWEIQPFLLKVSNKVMVSYNEPRAI